MRGIKMLNELWHGNQKMPFNNKEERQWDWERKDTIFPNFLVTEDLHEGRDYKEMMGQEKEIFTWSAW